MAYPPLSERQFPYVLLHVDPSDEEVKEYEVAQAADIEDLKGGLGHVRSEWSGPYRLSTDECLWIADGPAGSAFHIIGPWDGPASDALLTSTDIDHATAVQAYRLLERIIRDDGLRPTGDFHRPVHEFAVSQGWEGLYPEVCEHCRAVMDAREGV
jgi:hypothetical protein